ncbi:hypothetical protein Ga0466249_004817 [Sporomusaceae bacterium BoRhaA]|uniref:hypothetical protein n=1 Tax=Pelorhabdus rhamnosifermentans TaxID=2772457 RepID=UPI001C063535|nr:hypothetical protein [Pelorhabdus rhamnosifermentans]MBU2703669.1 hypothetical protein [Pelorhabdus rhamnosifermentans]
MKRIYLVFLVLFLVPALAFAENPKPTFTPTDTTLQGKPAVICETPHYRITVPKVWTYQSMYSEYRNEITLYGFSPEDNGFFIGTWQLKKNEDYNKYLENYIVDFKNNPNNAEQQIDDLSPNCKRLFYFLIGESRYCACYLIKEEDRVFMVVCRMGKDNYKDLPLFDEMVKTLELKS